MSKNKEKQKAIELRKKGYSYSEILKKIFVAKSTLSLWLRSVGLSEKQKQRLTKKKLAAAFRGAMARKKQRRVITEKIKSKAKEEIGKLTDRELWLLGIALYWAEGTKEKAHAARLQFANSDPEMIKLFLKWVQRVFKIPKSDIRFSIHLHETAKNRIDEIQKYWQKVASSPFSQFQKIIWKKHNIKTNRKNIGKEYRGLLKITIIKSSNLTRKVSGWIEGICNCGVV